VTAENTAEKTGSAGLRLLALRPGKKHKYGIWKPTREMYFCICLKFPDISHQKIP
jgi:hypothetical protein